MDYSSGSTVGREEAGAISVMHAAVESFECLDPIPISKHLSQRAALLVFSHLRWHFVTQRPQHLLRRASETRRVFFWEEPWMHDPIEAPAFVHAGGSLEFLAAEGANNVCVIRPHFFHGENVVEAQKRLLDGLVAARALKHSDRWYYTPMALSFSAHLVAEVTIYDCMDELSAFLDAPPDLLNKERELFRAADVVFTGGRSIYEAKRGQHSNVHLFPSSIDAKHFARARGVAADPADQADIPHPRAGFFGVLDERFDSALVRKVAALRQDLHFILIGPVVKIDPGTLPKAPNLHYLGMKSYQALPAYIANWDAAIMPFAMNQSTRYISPTKTPEYLAAGKRVVSTPIQDVVSDFGKLGLLEIALSPQEFAEALDRAVASTADPVWSLNVERKLASSSWDHTWRSMDQKIEAARGAKRREKDASKQLFAEVGTFVQDLVPSH